MTSVPTTSRDLRYRQQAERERRRAESYRSLLLGICEQHVRVLNVDVTVYEAILGEHDFLALKAALRSRSPA